MDRHGELVKRKPRELEDLWSLKIEADGTVRPEARFEQPRGRLAMLPWDVVALIWNRAHPGEEMTVERAAAVGLEAEKKLRGEGSLASLWAEMQ